MNISGLKIPRLEAKIVDFPELNGLNEIKGIVILTLNRSPEGSEGVVKRKNLSPFTLMPCRHKYTWLT